ncbi:MAG: DUF3015 family protein [Persicimonas sp.]
MTKLTKLLVALATVALAGLCALQTAAAQEAEQEEEAGADGAYGMAGCGLGSMVFGSEGGILQVFAATSNAFLGTQTFGITSGTSNCVDRGVVRESAEQEAFFEANYANLKAEMASGKGEHLEAMSSLLGCTEEVTPQVATASQESYEAVFPTEETTPGQALYSYKMQLSQDDELARSCTKL